MTTLAGFSAGKVRTPRDPMFTHDGMVMRPAGITMSSTGYDGSNTGYEYEIRAGWLVGQITATGEYVPCKRTKVNGTAGAVTEVVVDNSYAFKAGDVITIGGDTDITIVSIDYATHTLTIASTTVADNDLVFAQDGSQTCRGVLADFVKLKNHDNTQAADKAANLIIGGFVDDNYVLGDLAAVLEDPASIQFLKLIYFTDSPVAAAGAFTNLTASGTLTVTGAATLSSTLAVTTSIQTPILILTGTTGNQEMRLTTNLADALSIEDTAGDLIVFTTTTGAQVVAITPKVTMANGFTSAAQTITADDSESALNAIVAGVTAVVVDGVTNDANDFVTLPAIAGVPIGHTIHIACNGSSNFELRTPASSNTTINNVDSDGTQEYLCTDTDVIRVTKATATGWVAQSITNLGAVRTAVVPD